MAREVPLRGVNVLRLSLCILVFVTLSPALASAQDRPLHAQHRVVYDNLVAARLNPLGLEDRLNLGYRYRLYDDPGLLWRDAYAGVAFTPTLNPAVARVGASLEVKPLAVLMMSVGYYFVGWLGTFQYLQSHDSPHAAHSDAALDEGADAEKNYSTVGGELEIKVQALAKVGPVVLRNTLNLFHSDMRLKNGQRLYYNPRVDAMVPNQGWHLTNDTDLVWLFRFGLVAGLRTSVVHAFFDDEHYRAGESTENPNTPIVRMGPILAYVFYDRPESRFNKPTVLLIANWHISHRWRTGEDISQAVPYVVLGFKCSGELMKW